MKRAANHIQVIKLTLNSSYCKVTSFSLLPSCQLASSCFPLQTLQLVHDQEGFAHPFDIWLQLHRLGLHIEQSQIHGAP